MMKLTKRFTIPEFYSSVIKMSAVRALIIVLSFAGSVVLTRSIGPEGRGLVAWFVSAATVAMMFAQGGIEIVNRRFIAQNAALAGGMVRMTLKICLVGTLLVLPFFTYAVLHNNVGQHNIPLLVTAAIAVFFMAAAPCLGGIQLGLNMVKPYMWSGAMQKISNLLLVLFLVAVGMISPLTAVLALLLSYVVQVGMTLYSLRKLPKGTHKASFEFVWSKRSFTFYIYIMSILGAMVPAVVPLMLGAEHSLVSAGLFAACMIIVDAITKTFGMVSTYALPQIVGAKTKADKDRLKASVQTVSFWGMAGIAVVWVVNAGWAIPLILGEEFRPAVPIFQILCLHMVFVAVNDANQAIILAHSEKIVVLVTPMTMLLTSAGLCAVLIPLYGATGGALALLTSSAIGVMVSQLCIYMIHRREQHGELAG